jgi:hypothetical protein
MFTRFGYRRASSIAGLLLPRLTEVNHMFIQWTGHDAALKGPEALELLKTLPAGEQEATYEETARIHQVSLAHLFFPYEN